MKSILFAAAVLAGFTTVQTFAADCPDFSGEYEAISVRTPEGEQFPAPAGYYIVAIQQDGCGSVLLTEKKLGEEIKTEISVDGQKREAFDDPNVGKVYMIFEFQNQTLVGRFVDSRDRLVGRVTFSFNDQGDLVIAENLIDGGNVVDLIEITAKRK